MKVETFSDKTKGFLYIISNTMKIHVQMLKFEDFCSNFHRYNVRYKNQIII